MPERCFMVRKRKHTKWFAGVLDRWLSSPLELARATREMSEMKTLMAQPGGIARAAEALLRGRAISARRAA